jgi:CHASE2 domain-containing sensor protein/class 3 adenylate cyclase
MNRADKRRLRQTFELGLILTAAVIVVESLGWLSPLDRYLYDLRARTCRYFEPPPSDLIVHVDIDDQSHQQLGSFPWPRTKLARIVDELQRAGAKVIGFDVFFSEPQDTRWEKLGVNELGENEFREIHDDDVFAGAIKQAGNVLLPVSLVLRDEDDTSVATTQPSASLDRFAIPRPPGMPPMLTAVGERPVVETLFDAIFYSGAVEFASQPDAVIRSVPLLIDDRGRMIPHMALAAACAMLDVPVQSIRIYPNKIALPIPNKPWIEIPVRRMATDRHGRIGMVMDIPWLGTPGKDTWLTMYDFPSHRKPKNHLSLQNVWAIPQNISRMEQNDRAADDAIRTANALASSPAIKTYLAKPILERKAAERETMIAALLADLNQLGINALKSEDSSKLDADSQAILRAYLAIESHAESNRALQSLVDAARADLRKQLEGRYALVGWTATGRTDYYPTSMHPLCPGVVVQGAAINAILTNRFWRASPAWMGSVLILLIGGLTTLFVAVFSGLRAIFCTVLLVLGYFVINGVLLFDYADWIIPVAGPLAAGAVVWSATTLARNIDEARERARITRRFSSYADPAVVNFVLENPDSVRFDGQEKEMTVVFTDLAGFTTISERLREKTVPLLNEYMSRMLPIIRNNGGTWDKFLGDGIMFFYNAPRDNPNHAIDAVRTVLKMHDEIIEFNKALVERGLPMVSMRAGISTGMVVVGDAGSTDPTHNASDYTVIGDEVNLSARLESANKATGSRTLIESHTAEMARDLVLLRPIGTIRVVGKTEGAECFEPLALHIEATDEQRKLVEMSEAIVTSFRAGKFQECIEAAGRFEKEFGESKFSHLYITLCEQYLREPIADFDGQIVLTEK